MTNHYPNPWNFNNSDLQLTASNGRDKLVYSKLGEIAMGAPLGGHCHWTNEAGQNVNLGTWCGGPALWNFEGTMAVIPLWVRTFGEGTLQRLAVLNIETLGLTTYEQFFDVLDLRSFSNNRVYGYDSPIHKTKTVDFDLLTAKIESKRKVQQVAI
ncbi:MAG: hypothetical protein HEP71_26985 [Roseivirga sp.]|nr:hypothetical protein [Roseivirga sp.]